MGWENNKDHHFLVENVTLLNTVLYMVVQWLGPISKTFHEQILSKHMAITLKALMRSIHNSVHAMAADLSWYMQNPDLIEYFWMIKIRAKGFYRIYFMSS